MTDLFVPVWLALGLLMSIGAMFGMAISTKNGPMSASPLVAFFPFAAVTMLNDHRSALVIVGLSVLTFYAAWFLVIGSFMVAAHLRREAAMIKRLH
jgi:hypothetical protein